MKTNSPAQEEKLPFSNMVAKGKKRNITWTRKWDQTDVYNALAIGSLHVLCLFAPSTFDWSALRLAVTLYVVCGSLGITLSYHRNLAHKSFTLPEYLEHFLAYIGVHALQGAPIWWVSMHRFHHKHADTTRDLHSPKEGFWFSYVFWHLDNKYIDRKGADYRNANDLMEKRYYRFLERTYLLHVFLQGAVLYICGGFPFVVWGMGVRGVWGNNVSWLVSTIGHIWGQQVWNTGDLSKNNWLMAMLTYGDGWHNNHHAFEYSARFGLDRWEIDMAWYFIKLLENLGLATDVKFPSEIQKEKMSMRNGVEKSLVQGKGSGF